MALSGAGVVLGVVREALLILFFGFSDTTDTIHLYLLVTYSLGLLTDPIRLAGLNLFQSLPWRSVIGAAALVVAPFACIVAVSTALLTSHELRLPLLAGITVTGAVMQLNQLSMAYKQRGGAVVPTQLVMLIPNFVLIPGIVTVGLWGTADPVAGILLCFFLVPLVQAAALARIRATQPEVAGPAPPLRARVGLFARHGATAVGRQGFEIVARTAVIALGVGFLTLFSLVTRVYTATRIVLVDTFIGARVRSWSTGRERRSPPRPFLVLLGIPTVLALSAAGLLLALRIAGTESRWLFGLGYGVFLLLGFPYDAGARILYFAANARRVPRRLIMRIAGLEVLFAALAFAITRLSIAHVSVALLSWYVVKSAVQCRLILREAPTPGEV